MVMSLPCTNSETVDALFVTLFDMIDVAVFYLDADGKFTCASPAIERMTGRTPVELTGASFSSLLFADSMPVFSEMIRKATGTAVARDAWIVHADGGLIRCRIVFCARSGPGNFHVTGIMASKSQVDAEIEQRMQMFTVAVEQSPSTVVITDKAGAIQYVNPKFTRLTGYSFNDVLGHNPRILKSGKQTAEFYRNLWQTISSGREWRGEFHNLKKNGDSYWESASISPVVNRDGEITHYIAIKEDVTERKIAEENLRLSEEKLRSKNEQMERDLRNAQMAVARMLPDRPPRSERLRVDFRYLPMEAVGGDFFSFNTLHDSGLGVFIGDVAGHGVSAALFLALVRSLTERLNADWGTMPSGYLKELNVNLTETMSLAFFTALYGFFNFSGEHVLFRFAKGGHTPPVLFRAGEDTALGLYADGMPVGVSAAASFGDMEVELSPGDRIYLYTDGVTEARNTDKDMLETEGLLDIVRRGGAQELGRSLDFILDETARFRENLPAEDDIILIGFEVL